MLAPRRRVLDAILVRAAADAGAEVREAFAVQDLLWDEGRVVGIRGRARGGALVEERATVVVGADGIHSTVAEAVQAPRYDETAPLTFAYYSYWSDVPVARLEVSLRPGRVLIAFPTNDGLVCRAVQAPHAEFAVFRADIAGNFARSLALVPALAERVAAGRRAERWLGTADLPNFFRRPYVPGWALVGDAGHHKDPILAHGVSEAFRAAALLAGALDAGLSGRAVLATALAGSEAARNAAAGPLHALTLRTCAFLPPPPAVVAQRAALRADPLARDRYVAALLDAGDPAA